MNDNKGGNWGNWIYDIFYYYNYSRVIISKKMDLVEKVIVTGVFVITFPLCYLSVFKPNYKIVDILMILFLIWTFGGLIILSIRARRKRRG